MATRGVSTVVTYRAWDTGANAPKTGDSGNHTLKWLKDGTSSSTTNSPAEVDSTNSPGIYKVTLTSTETDCTFGVLSGKSSISGVYIFGVQVGFDYVPTSNTITHLNTIYDTDYATVYDATNKAFLSKLGNFAMGGSSLALTTGAIVGATLTLSGAVAFQSTFAVTGTVTYNAFTVTNALTVGGTTTLTGAVSAGAAFTITGNFTAANLTNARIGYLDNLNVGGPVASHADILSINQSASKHVLLQTVGQYERPESGNTVYTVEARTFTAADGAAVNADTTPTLTATGQTSGSLAANVSSATNPSTGVYRWTYTVSSSATSEPIRFDVSATISSSTFTLSCYSQVVDEVSATWTSTDATHLTAIYNKLPAIGNIGSQASLDLLVDGVNVTTWKGATPASLVNGALKSNVWAYCDVNIGNGVLAVDPANVADNFTALFAQAPYPQNVIWSWTTRTLTAGTNITLAKGTNITGFNDLDAAGVRGAVGLSAASLDTQLTAIKTDTGNLVARITSTLFAGITSLAQWLGAGFGKQTANSTARTEIRATGAGTGTFLETDDSLEAIADNAGGGGGGGTVTGYAAGMSPEILVLDALAADHDIAGTIGQKINAAGGAADPLLNDVPGVYASGTAGAALGRLGTGDITTVSPVSLSGDVEIVRGDSYLSADASALEWANPDGTWPDLTGATILFEAARGRYTAAGSVVTPTGTQKVRVELTADQSTAFKIGLADSAAFDFFIRATLSNSHVRTLVRGRVTVLNPEDSL